MPDEATTTEPAVEQDATTPETGVQSTDADSPADGAEQLGDAGKQAIDRMKAERNEARKEAAKAREALAAAQAKAEGREVEYAAEKKAREDADARFRERVLKAEIKAAATGKLNDPADAMRYLDMDSFDVNDDGDVDASAISAAIDALVESKSYLAVQDGRRFTGTPDAGTRKETGPQQYTREDMARMTPEQRADAFDKGLFADLLSGK